MKATATRNIFVLGDDQFNEDHHLKPLSASYGFNFRPLTQWSESRVDRRPVLETLEEARRRLKCFDGNIDGLLTFFDFPVSLIAPILCEEFNLPSPSVKAVVRCEHKYWSRMLQKEAAPEVVPPFSLLKLTEKPRDAWNRLAKEGIEAPFWMKPVKGVLGMLAFHIKTFEDLEKAMPIAAEKVDYFAKPVHELFQEIDVQLPEEVAGEGAERLFLVEKDISVPLGCTAEGYRFDGETHIHGIVDSYRYPGRSPFHRYQYPSKFPESVQERMADASARVLEKIGYDGGAFNIEFFWDPETDRLSLLEINPRISQSHSPQFQMVDGDSNMKVIADLALGQKPHLVHRNGDFKIAAKLMLRVFVEDGVVTKTPGDAEIEAVRQRFPGSLIVPTVELGQRLSEQADTDSYSHELGEFYMGARNEEELLTHFNEAVEMLSFEVDGASIEVPEPQEAIIEIEP